MIFPAWKAWSRQNSSLCRWCFRNTWKYHFLAFWWKSWVWIKERKSNASSPFRYIKLRHWEAKWKLVLWSSVHGHARRVPPQMWKQKLFAEELARDNPCCGDQRSGHLFWALQLFFHDLLQAQICLFQLIFSASVVHFPVRARTVGGRLREYRVAVLSSNNKEKLVKSYTHVLFNRAI